MELLVVVSIIGLLASTVLATMSGLRARARDTAVKRGVREFEKLMQLEYSETGSYTNLETCSWVPFTSPDCNSMFSGVYAQQARNICTNIVSNATPQWGPPGYSFLVCNAVDNAQTYSIMASLSTGHWFCSGSNGVGNNVDYYALPYPLGCYYNP